MFGLPGAGVFAVEIIVPFGVRSFAEEIVVLFGTWLFAAEIIVLFGTWSFAEEIIVLFGTWPFAAAEIAGLDNVAVFSVGSDGTDGPTDAAGGYADGNTEKTIFEKDGRTIAQVLAENDAYHALQAADGLIVTGPTGTNVNDVAAVLVRPGKKE